MQDTDASGAGKSGRLRRGLLWAFLAVLLLGNIALLVAGNHFYNVIMTYHTLNRYTPQEYAETAALVGYQASQDDALRTEEVVVDSPHGYQLQGIFIRNAIPTENTVILVHGIGKDKMWSIMKYGDIFLDLQFNIFVYDSRGHGDSGGGRPGYGYYEQDDLRAIVQFVKAQNPNGLIGIHSESLGAASALMYVEKYPDDNDVSFIVEDCAYSDLGEVYLARAADYDVPVLLRPLVIDYLSIVCRLRSGFLIGDVSPIEELTLVKTPILFIHGENDDFTPPQMAREMFESKTGVKGLYYAPLAGHAESLDVDKIRYVQEIGNFLKIALANREPGQ